MCFLSQPFKKIVAKSKGSKDAPVDREGFVIQESQKSRAYVLGSGSKYSASPKQQIIQ